MRISIDLPVFSSSTQAYGWFSGVVETEGLPAVGEPFAWPRHWLSRFSDTFQGQSLQVWGVSDGLVAGVRCHVTMFGLVVEGRSAAAELAAHIEAVSAIPFTLHEEVEDGDA